MIGSCKRPGTGLPFIAMEGPIPRTTTRLERPPLTIKPAIETLSPVSTRARPAMLSSCTLAGVALGEAVAVGVAVAVAVAVGVGLGVPGGGAGAVGGGEAPRTQSAA